MKERIIKILQDNLNTELLEVENNSYLHQGHAGDNGTGETHFKVTIKSSDFANLNALASHRKINSLLKNEFTKGLHALELKIVK